MATLTEDLKKHIDRIAAKLLNEGLTGSLFVHKMIDGFSPEIKKAMIKMNKK